MIKISEKKNIKEMIGSFRDLIVRNKIKTIGVVALIVISPLIYGFGDATTDTIRYINTEQGQLLFFNINENDIEDEEVREWVESNHMNKGVHVYKEDYQEGKLVLMATGEQPIGGITISMESVVGQEDIILLNGVVRPPRDEIEDGPTYPYMLLKIDVKDDPREVHLGTLNLYDVFRGVEKPISKSVDTGVIQEIDGNKIKLIAFNGNENYPFYVLSDMAVKEMETRELKKGDMVAVSIDKTPSEYPVIESIKLANNIVAGVVIESFDKEEREVELSVNNLSISMKYDESIGTMIEEIEIGEGYAVKLLYDGKDITVGRIIGRN